MDTLLIHYIYIRETRIAQPCGFEGHNYMILHVNYMILHVNYMILHVINMLYCKKRQLSYTSNLEYIKPSFSKISGEKHGNKTE